MNKRCDHKKGVAINPSVGGEIDPSVGVVLFRWSYIVWVAKLSHRLISVLHCVGRIT